MLNKVVIGLTVSFPFIASSGEDFPVACKISNSNKFTSTAIPKKNIRLSGEWCDDTFFVSQQSYEEALQICLESRAHMALENYGVYMTPGSPELDSWDAKPVVLGMLSVRRYDVLPVTEPIACAAHSCTH